jgi:hypothetical protein
MRRAKGARRALLIAQERQQKARGIYLSFASQAAPAQGKEEITERSD